MGIDTKLLSKSIIKAGPVFNAYPDSIGGTLGDIVKFLQSPELKNVFHSFYILPSIFNTDLDRGFSIIDYELNELYASKEDLEKLDEIGIALKFDFVLNHSSVLSKQFQDILFFQAFKCCIRSICDFKQIFLTDFGLSGLSKYGFRQKYFEQLFLLFCLFERIERYIQFFF